MKHACSSCGSKFRAIDRDACDVSEIRKEMRREGITTTTKRGDE